MNYFVILLQVEVYRGASGPVATLTHWYGLSIIDTPCALHQCGTNSLWKKLPVRAPLGTSNPMGIPADSARLLRPGDLLSLQVPLLFGHHPG